MAWGVAAVSECNTTVTYTYGCDATDATNASNGMIVASIYRHDDCCPEATGQSMFVHAHPERSGWVDRGQSLKRGVPRVLTTKRVCGEQRCWVGG